MIPLGDTEAELCYRLGSGPGGTVMAITHTEVPPAQEGRGLAAQLTQAAVDHARASGWRIRPLCSYAQAWLQRHPDQLDLVETL
ncbi:MAG: GNAT family N-acetyltransferase [Aquabacterium sp.]